MNRDIHGLNDLIKIEINNEEVHKLLREQLTLIVNEDSILDYVFWDTKELKRRTCMCWNTIQETFFYDPEFPKRKIGGKWYYPAREARQYLELWLMNQ